MEEYKDSIAIIEESEIEKRKSEYGNRFCKITKEMIESLANEKILIINDGEYCTFLKYFQD